MKIFASGDAMSFWENEPSVQTGFSRVVGVIELNKDDKYNSTGWSGIKAVVNIDDKLFILDFPENVRVETNDGVLIWEDQKAWWPSLEEAKGQDLFIFKFDM